ncbi:CAF17-like 4Fe-4S cluster assembly/insertion protein YgfZ [Pollutimonas thiosulfatoxidans]|uniref:Folate-binding protein YgfZ n=1 Tax=Pollutimonas thiosulfatoxidans TaxID=2028345 RepID=A0A410GAV2_9BURK|nr:folate-binding protein YgfZ [Pollutimonas thiosulfatoxidans]QAA93421.1 hypothetical protein CKA81_05925 [Pollutimonas thiosulfatoxidans]
MSSAAYPYMPLTDLAVIDITGADAAAFLHGQLTHDVTGLASGQARLSGYCTAKGRLLATLVFWHDNSGGEPRIRALVPDDVADALIKRLSMFVLRAKVSLQRSAAAVGGAMVGAGNAAPEGTLADEAAALPASPAPWATANTPSATWIAAPTSPGAAARWWVVVEEPDLLSPFASCNADDWRVQDISAGLPWIRNATQDLFIPQTLNLDLIDGLSFTKGCYPGQEVVARSHYRGVVKRRTAYGTVAQPGDLATDQLVGTDTYDARQPDNPCGRIINAAQASNGAVHVLMEVQLADLGQADFRAEGPQGPAISVQPLPYEIVVER